MATSRLPDHPDLDQLKNHAKLFQRLVRAGFPEAIQLVREFHPRLAGPGTDLARLSLADAQLVVARQYGFASWPKLRRYLETVTRYSSSPHDQPIGQPIRDAASLADEFLRLACLYYAGDDPTRRDQARRLLADHPELATATIHTMAAVGDGAAAADLLERDPAQARLVGGPYGWEPLLYLAYSRLDSTSPKHSTLEVARLLLDHGADPNAGFLWEGLPSPFTVLTGAFGRGEGDPPPHQYRTQLARLLLTRGADPNDSQLLYNCGLGAATPGSSDSEPDHLELLFEFGLGQGSGGPWHARLAPMHPTPAQLLHQELLNAAARGLASRVTRLLDHHVDVHGTGTSHPIFQGHSAYELAALNGHTDVVALLERAGAGPATADPVLAFLSACSRDDRGAVRGLRAGDPTLPGRAVAREPDLIVRAAEHGHGGAVRLMVEQGFDVNARRRSGSQTSPLHEAAWNGDLALVELLLDLGSDPTIVDGSYQSTALGWAEHNHRDEVVRYLSSRPSS